MKTSTMPTVEKRKYTRLNTELPVKLGIEKLIQKQALCKNISKGGIYIEIEKDKLNENEIYILNTIQGNLQIELSLKNGKDKITAIVAIRWIKQSEDKIGCGLEFLEISSSIRNRIDSYVSKHRELTEEREYEHKTISRFGDDILSDRRKHPRVKITFPVELKIGESIFDMPSNIRGESVDISEGGMKLIKKGPFVSASAIYINLPPCYSEDPTKAQGIEVRVELRWSRPIATANKFLYGFHFLEMKEKDRNILRDIIKNEREQSSQKTLFITRPKIDFHREPHSCNMYCVDLTIGCENKCLYCHFSKLNEEYWQKRYPFPQEYPIPVDISPIYYRSEFPNSVIYLSPSSDPFASKTKELTHELLSFLLPKGLKFAISTKEIIPEKTLELIKQYLAQVEVEIGIANLDSKRNALLESGCPSAAERLAILQRLVEIGCFVGVRMDPIFPIIDDNDQTLECTIKTIAKTGTRYITTSYLFTYGRFLRRLKKEPMLKESLEYINEKCFVAGGTALSVPLKMKKQTYEKINFICCNYGITFSTCGCKEVELRDTNYPLVCRRTIH